jgi:hypothetical protein
MGNKKNKERKKKKKLSIKMVNPKLSPEALFKEVEKPVGFTKKFVKKEKQKLF